MTRSWLVLGGWSLTFLLIALGVYRARKRVRREEEESRRRLAGLFRDYGEQQEDRR